MSTTSLEQLIEQFVESGTMFIAVDETTVDEPALRMYYHLHRDTNPETQQSLFETIHDEFGYAPHPELDEDDISDARKTEEGLFENVRIGDKSYTIHLYHIQIEHVHTVQRIPIFANPGISGIDEQTVEAGITGLSDALTDDGRAQLATQKVALTDLLNDLADAGAASVEVNKYLAKQGCLDLVVPINPLPKGHEILAPIDTVTHDGEEFDLRYEVTTMGPTGSGLEKVALYVSENVMGLEPKSITDGLDEFEQTIGLSSTTGQQLPTVNGQDVDGIRVDADVVEATEAATEKARNRNQHRAEEYRAAERAEPLTYTVRSETLKPGPDWPMTAHVLDANKTYYTDDEKVIEEALEDALSVIDGRMIAPDDLSTGESVTAEELLDRIDSSRPTATQKTRDSDGSTAVDGGDVPIEESLQYEMDVADVWEQGRGEGHVVQARVTVWERETGAEATYVLSNQVDIGWCARCVEGDDSLDSDAVVNWLRDNSPIYTGHRQFETDGWVPNDGWGH